VVGSTCRAARATRDGISVPVRAVSWFPCLVYNRSAVSGIGAWNVSLAGVGGPVGQQLRDLYYGQFERIALDQGMAAVAADPYWAARIEANPANRGRLLSQDPAEFAIVMRRWAQGIRVEDPVFGASADDLRAVGVPTAILTAAAGDGGHPREASVRAAGLIPDCELIEAESFHAEWPGLQRQALANYEQAPSLAELITAWLN
jgi:2-hydroxy-6-oxonona-2,4-dienedioate hydrolase